MSCVWSQEAPLVDFCSRLCNAGNPLRKEREPSLLSLPGQESPACHSTDGPQTSPADSLAAHGSLRSPFASRASLCFALAALAHPPEAHALPSTRSLCSLTRTSHGVDSRASLRSATRASARHRTNLWRFETAGQTCVNTETGFWGRGPQETGRGSGDERCEGDYREASTGEGGAVRGRPQGALGSERGGATCE